jgi:RimJ/RimL family protein N-acetyltransferase
MVHLRADVVLTPLGLEHAERMCTWMRDPAVHAGVGLRTEPTLEKTYEWLNRALADTDTWAFAVLLAGRHVGNVVLDRRDRYLQTARLSIYIGEVSARGRGVGTTGVYRAARTAFNDWGLHKLWLTARAENAAALAAYERVGFRREGLLRDEFLYAGQRHDAVYMGLLRADFAGVLAQSEHAELAARGAS